MAKCTCCLNSVLEQCSKPSVPGISWLVTGFPMNDRPPKGSFKTRSPRSHPPSDHCSPPRCREEVKLVATRCRKRTSCARKTIQSHSSGWDCRWKEWMEHLGGKTFGKGPFPKKRFSWKVWKRNRVKRFEQNGVEMGWKMIGWKRNWMEHFKMIQGQGKGMKLVSDQDRMRLGLKVKER